MQQPKVHGSLGLGHPSVPFTFISVSSLLQVVDGQFKDYKWGYDYFLEQNASERKQMQAKEAKQKAVQNSTIKAKSKVWNVLINIVQTIH